MKALAIVKAPVMVALLAVGLLSLTLISVPSVRAQESDLPVGSHPRRGKHLIVIPAPIANVQVVPSGSAPTGHAAQIVARLPNSCASPGGYSLDRHGTAFKIRVLNVLEVGPGRCTKTNTTYDLRVNLGTDFVPGAEYTLKVNGRSLRFTAGGGVVPPPSDGIVMPAPIEEINIAVLLSSPPQYMLHIVAGLPSGCAAPGGYDVTRSGNEITVSVKNTYPSAEPVCTMVYRTYELHVNLGSDFVAGTEYTVKVNGKTTTFIAR